MNVDKKLLERVSANARIKLSPEEIKAFLPQLKEILAAFSQIDKIDTKKVKPSFQPIPLKDRWREDETEECLSQEQALQNTEHRKNGYFKGPKVL